MLITQLLQNILRYEMNYYQTVIKTLKDVDNYRRDDENNRPKRKV